MQTLEHLRLGFRHILAQHSGDFPKGQGHLEMSAHQGMFFFFSLLRDCCCCCSKSRGLKTLLRQSLGAQQSEQSQWSLHTQENMLCFSSPELGKKGSLYQQWLLCVEARLWSRDHEKTKKIKAHMWHVFQQTHTHTNTIAHTQKVMFSSAAL